MIEHDATHELPQPLSFLAGGGEMGSVIRAYNWEQTPLGVPEGWPQSLKTAVRIMLTSRQPIWIGWGDDLTYLYNDAYRSIIGGKHPWAIGRATREVWKEIWTQIEPMLDTAMGGDEGTYVEEDLLIMERNGYQEETYYTYSYSPIPDDDGTPGGIICANTDDTQRVQNERQLALLRELATRTVDAHTWREACERGASALIRNPRDITFALVYARPNANDTFELGGSIGLAEPDHASLHTITLHADKTWRVAEALASQKIQIIEGIPERFKDCVGADGIWNIASKTIAVVPITSQRDKARDGVLIIGLNPYRLLDKHYEEFLIHMATQFSDAIAGADAYEQERRRVEALDELHRAKTTFFSNVSHEFRTPLTLMLGPLEDVLAAPMSTEQVRENVEVAHRNGLRLLRLVNSLLDFSRIESGRVRATYQPTDLIAFSFELASTFRSAIERAGIQLELESEPLPNPAYVDHDMWEKILLNLLSNAFKFTLEGKICVSIKPSADNSSAIIRVRDTGVGVPSHELPHLFERFHRVEGQKSRSIEGSGIGLALVHELVKLHRGDVYSESTVGVGTTMTIVMPLGRAFLPDDQIRETQTSGSTNSARVQEYVDEALRWMPADQTSELPVSEPAEITNTDAVSAHQRRKRILLADDNADMRDYITRLLKGRWDIETVADGKDALDVIHTRTPDLVLTDVMMPRLDGFGLLQAIRNNDDTKELPVIILSARAGEEARVEGLDARADDYLTKPFSARELIARIESNLDLAQIRSDAKSAIREREERLRAALDASGTGTFRWHNERDIFDYDESFGRLFGVPFRWQAQTLQDFLSRVHHEDQSRVWQSCTMCAREGHALEEEFRVVFPGGVIRWLFAKAETFQDAEGHVLYLTGACVDITERKKSQLILQQRTSQFETLLDQAPLGVYLVDGDFKIREVNPTARPVFRNIPDLIGRDFKEVIRILWSPAYADEVVRIFQRTLETGEPYYMPELSERREDTGDVEYYEWLASRIPLPDNGFGVVCYFHDISEEVLARQAIAHSEERLRDLNQDLENRVVEEVSKRIKAEEALRHAQKMEAVGQLTGGIAHDFNNLLTVILGGLETIQRSKPEDEARRARALEMSFKGAQRAANLTSRLLAFSRRQPLDPKLIDINILVRDMTDLLHRTLGEQIELEGVLSPRLWPVEADKNQLENAIINLAVNARDAMPDGGKLTIETINTALDESYSATDAEVIPGQYICIAVSDTGEGMSKETSSRAFEPFFTTKEVGRGTGLGLSMIYGFVKQSGGHVSIYSELGQGTTVRLYFPRSLGVTKTISSVAAPITPKSSAGEVVLVVEDNDEVRAYSVMALGELGYRVLQAANAEGAFEIIKSDQRIDLLFTDVVLPGKSGRAIADEAAHYRPNLKVLFATGYSRNAIVHHGRLDPGVNLITKPFTFEQLAARVRDVLDQ